MFGRSIAAKHLLRFATGALLVISATGTAVPVYADTLLREEANTVGRPLSPNLPLPQCPPETYENSSGICVPRPVQPDPSQPQTPPGNATAKCRDGSWSFSQHRTGTCSGHGGVAQWL
ncbi:DUF3761 domain-containing protein [Mycobacterium sp. 852014-52450_SCH5900713]|uniref:DUF3761 domain-containing protein n=1 Tax=Mycobacterium sp. 852014-52450_SCH5900713 TaxID=1834116 RepID=UPI001E3BD94A|nr:DUF3761 domain-containing protein [Mycobacterium sp. 852014-52450_SCH5900713]